MGKPGVKQEQKLVAERYRYLAPFIDTARDVYVSLDGQTALLAVQQSHFRDGTIPDLWFSVTGSTEPLLIEAKALDPSGRVLFMHTQLKAWRTNGHGERRGCRSPNRDSKWVRSGHSKAELI